MMERTTITAVLMETMMATVLVTLLLSTVIIEAAAVGEVVVCVASIGNKTKNKRIQSCSSSYDIVWQHTIRFIRNIYIYIITTTPVI